MDALGIPFAIGCVVVYVVAVLFLSRFCSLSNPPKERPRETDGEWTELRQANTQAFWAEMEERARRSDERRARWQERKAS